MAKKKKREQDKKAEPICQLVIRERLKALDDSVDAAVHSIADHVGLADAVSTVTNGIFMSAAAVVWHATSFSEEEFIETARRCYRRIAAGHAHCERGDDDGSMLHQQGRENLN